jgi:hypothetical protein
MYFRRAGELKARADEADQGGAFSVGHCLPRV